MEFPATARLWTDEETVRLAVGSALENAFEHAAATVTVTVEARFDECNIAIGDAGPDLQHGTGLGLWQLRWSVTKPNGGRSARTMVPSPASQCPTGAG